MELKEMIKVMQHYADDGEIEASKKHVQIWVGASLPCWDWDTFDYRIKEPKKEKVTIEKWLMQSTIDKEYRIIETSLVDKVVNFKKVKLIKSYEVEL